MRRRTFLTAAAAAPLASLAPRVAGAAIHAGDGPYGALATAPDALGLLLPDGFTARVVATSGEVVAGSDYEWHPFPDGGACFATDAGGWIYVSNSEFGVGTSGVGAIAFDGDGRIIGAYPILTGSTRNCAGGPTPWGTWLSCEEVEGGKVYECDPTGTAAAVDLPALGRFIHEAACVDPDREQFYLTEDAPDGRLYRFTPEAYPSLTSGVLEVAAVSGAEVTWIEVPDPSGAFAPTRRQVAASTAFNGGEGIWYRDGIVWFVTKGDSGVWKLDAAAQRIEQIYRGADGEVVLGGPDNITLTDTGDLYVCEDQGADQQVVLITPDGIVAPVLQLTGQTGSELAGVAFDPSGTRMYVSSQRGNGGLGITYEVSGPFRMPEPETTTLPPTTSSPPTVTDTTVSGTTRAIASTVAGDEGGTSPLVPIGIGGALVAAVGYGAYRLRTRRG
jgi:secreted PhoX family phosphatase